MPGMIPSALDSFSFGVVVIDCALVSYRRRAIFGRDLCKVCMRKLVRDMLMINRGKRCFEEEIFSAFVLLLLAK